MRLTDYYQYGSENEEEQQTSEKFNKKEPPDKPTQTDVNEFIELIIKKETGINRELFKKHFNFQMPTAILKNIYDLNNKNKNNELKNITKSGLSDFKNEIEKMKKKKLKNHMK